MRAFFVVFFTQSLGAWRNLGRVVGRRCQGEETKIHHGNLGWKTPFLRRNERDKEPKNQILANINKYLNINEYWRIPTY